eukprot:976631_1
MSYIVEEPDSDDEKKEEILEIQIPNPYRNTPLWQQNHEISKKLEGMLNIITEIPAFDDKRSQLALSFAKAMQSNSKELIATQTTLRQCVQSIAHVISYKPALFENNEQKKRWNLIYQFNSSIRSQIIKTLDCTAEWFGFLLLLQHGLAYFYQTMANGEGTADIAILKFQQAAKQVSDFQKNNSDAFLAIREKSEGAMKEIMETFSGSQAIKDAQAHLEIHYKQHAEEMEKLEEMQSEKLDKIMETEKEIARLKGELSMYQVQLKYANNEISNLGEEQQFAADRARKMMKKAESASNYRKEFKEIKFFKWKLFTIRTDKQTGELDRLTKIAETYRNIRNSARSVKEAKIQIKKQATQEIKKTKKQIDTLTQRKHELITQEKERIEMQTKRVSAAKKRYEDDIKTIQTATKSCGVGEHSIEQFFSSTQQLSHQSLKAIEATKRIEVSIRALSQIISSLCESVWTIAAYFKEKEKLSDKMINLFHENGCHLLSDLICKDEKEFNDTILCFMKDVAKPVEIRKIRRLSIDKTKISEWKKSEKSLGKSNTLNLLHQVPALSSFFPSLHCRLKFAWEILKIKDCANNEQILQILPKEIKELTLNDKRSIKAITFIEEPSQTKQQQEYELNDQHDMKSWFENVLKLPQYYELFMDEGYEDMSYFDESVTESDLLNDIGIKKKPHRRKILNEIKKLTGKTSKTKPKIEKPMEEKERKQTFDEDDSDTKISEDILKTETLLLRKLIDTDTAKCIDDDFDKIIISFDENKWYTKLKLLLEQG